MIKNNDKKTFKSSKIFKPKIVVKTIYVGNKKLINVFAEVIAMGISKKD